MALTMARLVVVGFLALGSCALGCTTTEGPPKVAPVADAGPKVEAPPTPEPKPDPLPEPPPEPEPVARAVIASVQMIQDCPTRSDGFRPPPAATSPAAGGKLSTPKRAARSSGGSAGASLSGHGPRQPCTQSTMQLVFSDPGDRTEHVEIDGVRMLDPTSGKELATLVAREPAAWADGAYLSWDQTLAPGQEVKASYALSVPDWSAVETAIGSSYGVMFVLEVDVKVGDETQTVRSAEFPRERPHVIVT